MKVRFRDAGAGDGWRFRGYGLRADVRGLGAAQFPPTLRPGASGTDVSKLQDLLNAHGFPTAHTGEYDSVATLKAVQDFQDAAGLEVDGVVGPMTWTALDPARYSSAPAPKPPKLGPMVPGGSGLPFDPLMIGGVALVVFAAYKLFFSR